MIKTKTVFVLGAGASITYGLPTGAKLKAEICADLLNGHDHYMQHGYNRKMVNDFRANLYATAQDSIDAWLGKPANKPFEKIGKVAISRILLGHENTQSLFRNIVDSHLSTSGPIQCWYRHLFKKIESPFEKFGDNNLSIITFNYDRSLEHFLYTALCADNQGKDEKVIAKAVKSLEIVHVHGQLGYLPWQSEQDVVPYDTHTKEYHKVSRAADNIKIIYEASELDAQFVRARELLQSADRICIIGFGFNSTNLKRLGFNELKFKDNLDVQATAPNPTKEQLVNINKYIGSPLGIRFTKHDQTAFNFLCYNIDLT